MIIDTKELLTVKNFAASIGRSPQRVYQLDKVNGSNVKIIHIDGLKFVKKQKVF